MSDTFMTGDLRPIGILDSGFGGLSVLRAIRGELPHEYCIYAADCAFAPWGDRTDAFINERVDLVVKFLLAKNIKALVLACNTATAVSAARLREVLSIPVVGIEPAVLPAVRQTANGVVGILATKKTIASAKYAKLKKQAQEWAGKNGKAPVEILDCPCPGLMECVEAGAFEADYTKALITRYVKPLVAEGADILALGCTHYPFLAKALQEIAGPGVKLCDPAPAVARQLRRRLAECGALAPESASPTDFEFFVSGCDADRQTLLERLWKPGAKFRELA